jgi:hypothetical protein
MSTKYNLANANFAFEDAETGIILEGIDQDWSIDELWQRNHAGVEDGLVMYNPKMDGSLTGKIAGSTGLAAAAPAATLTIANIISAHGVTAGLVICRRVRRNRTNTTLDAITVEFTRRPGITA